MNKSKTLILLALSPLMLGAACADDGATLGPDTQATPRADGGACPLASPYRDAEGHTISFTEKFGEGAIEKIRCNEERTDVKLVLQVNAAMDGKDRMYGFHNLPNVLNDIQITNDVENWKVAVVVHSGGYPFVLDPRVPHPHPLAYALDKTTTGPRPEELFADRTAPLAPYEVVERLIELGVDVYFCLNTAAALNIKNDQVIPGVKYVPAGLTAIADFQRAGYLYVQP